MKKDISISIVFLLLYFLPDKEHFRILSALDNFKIRNIRINNTNFLHELLVKHQKNKLI